MMASCLLMVLSGAAPDTAAEVERLRPRMRAVNQAIWSYAEPGLEEHRSSAELIGWLKENGFTVREGVADMPTAFVASYGSGKPVVGILAEYDALLGLSQEAVPSRKPRADPSIVAGHGCGHSIYGTGSTAAALAVKRVLEERRLPGTIRLYGTPAEETVDAKTFMLRAGLFSDVDTVLNWHASRSDEFRTPIVRGMARTRPKEHARKRVLTDVELQAFWKATEPRNAYNRMLRFILLTATRLREASNMRRSELNGEWLIPAARYKGNHDHLIPLSDAARAVLDDLPVLGLCR